MVSMYDLPFVADISGFPNIELALPNPGIRAAAGVKGLCIHIVSYVAKSHQSQGAPSSSQACPKTFGVVDGVGGVLRRRGGDEN